MGTALRRNHSAFVLPDAASAVTIGNFDGLHSGHRALIAETVKAKQALGKGAQAVVVSFYPHPGEVLGKAGHLPRITTLHQKMAILSEWGVDLLFLIHFTKQFSRVTATTFLDEILIGKLKAQSLYIGPDASVGFRKEGTPEFIKAHLAALGKETHVLSFVDADGSAISSRRIRSLLVDGEVSAASQLLARPFVYRSRVVRGDQRGRLLGYPTANLFPNEQVVPKNGIYAARVKVLGAEYAAAVSVGTRPTFNGQGVKIEAHLLDFSGPQLYGEIIEVAFVERIRDELKFNGVEELCAHIEQDIATTRRILSRPLR